MERRQIHIAGMQETHIDKNIDWARQGYRPITSAAEKEQDGDNITTNKIGGVPFL